MDTESASLSVEEAFEAARVYLERWWRREPEATTKDVLTGWVPGRAAASPTALFEWERAARLVVGRRTRGGRTYGVVLRRRGAEFVTVTSASAEPPAGKDLETEQLSFGQALEAALRYVDSWDRRGTTGLVDLLSGSQLAGPGATMDPALWHVYIACAREVLRVDRPATHSDTHEL
jgi:hypothetical protein